MDPRGVRVTHNAYRKSSKETRGSYSLNEGPNAGLIRIWVFLPIAYKFSVGLIKMRVLFEGAFFGGFMVHQVYE